MVKRKPVGHASEVAAGQRFAFGKNWREFLAGLNEERIGSACRSLQSLTGIENLDGKRFLDVGSGSGLFSLAAMRLGAAFVHSFDYDPGSVECARELKQMHYPGDARWKVSEGSVLDRPFVGSLGRFDVVYSWGVLHHTGDMLQALENVRHLVASGGVLILAIYNDQGWRSGLWKGIKKMYCGTPRPLRPVLFFPIPFFLELKHAALEIANGRLPFENRWRTEKRGMSPYHDWIDWLGGYPFEVAKPEEVFSFFKRNGFELEKLITCQGGFGNNEYVFRRP